MRRRRGSSVTTIKVDNEQRILIEAIKHDIGAVEDVTVLARFAEKLGLVLAGDQTDAIVAGDEEVPLTEQERSTPSAYRWQMKSRRCSKTRASLVACLTMATIFSESPPGDRASCRPATAVPSSSAGSACRRRETAGERAMTSTRSIEFASSLRSNFVSSGPARPCP